MSRQIVRELSSARAVFALHCNYPDRMHHGICSPANGAYNEIRDDRQVAQEFGVLVKLGVRKGAAQPPRRSEFRVVGPDMQKVFGFSMLKGRFFNESDTPTSQLGAVVNRAFVKEYLGDDQDSGKIGRTNPSRRQQRSVFGCNRCAGG
jgi:hypothetical protein